MQGTAAVGCLQCRLALPHQSSICPCRPRCYVLAAVVKPPHVFRFRCCSAKEEKASWLLHFLKQAPLAHLDLEKPASQNVVLRERGTGCVLLLCWFKKTTGYSFTLARRLAFQCTCVRQRRLPGVSEVAGSCGHPRCSGGQKLLRQDAAATCARLLSPSAGECAAAGFSTACLHGTTHTVRAWFLAPFLCTSHVGLW